MSFVARPGNSPKWADDLPEGWSADWVKWSVAFASTKPTDEDTEKLPYISNEDIASWTGKMLKEAPEPADKEGRVFLRDDVLFNKLRPYLAKVYHADFDGISSGELLNLRASDRVLPRFLFHVLSSSAFIDTINAETFGTKMPRADWETVGHQPLPLPDLDTQRRIAGYLDDKTARIDALIEKKRALLDRLAEKRQALITRAVTRGLNPAAPLKDSGIDWLGKVPAHWQIRRMRFDALTSPSKREITLDPETPVSFVPMASIGEFGGMQLDETRPIDEVSTGYTYFREGDVCIAKITPCFENAKGALAEGLIEGIGFATTEIYVVRGKETALSSFLFLVSMSQPFRSFGTSEMLGAGGQKRVPERFIKDWMLPLPPVEEQQDIVQQVSIDLRLIDHAASAVECSVEKLTEYRAALVTAAVTGKIKALLTDETPKPAKKEVPAAFKRSVLAAYIADTLCDHPTFGRVKFQKLLHLCEAHLEIQEVAGNYHRDAAGPFDTQMMQSVHSQIEKQGWIAPVKGDKGWIYARGEKVDGYRAHFDRYFGDRKEALEDLLALIAPMRTQQAEIVSTAFAAWNDLLLEGKTPTDDEIVDLILNDWTESKKAISADRWHSALAWMREKGLTPRGLGKHTKRKS